MLQKTDKGGLQQKALQAAKGQLSLMAALVDCFGWLQEQRYAVQVTRELRRTRHIGTQRAEPRIKMIGQSSEE